MVVFPALQKYYSSLNHIAHFYYDNDFCDNISSLDAFFSEFRSITYVLQKSISDNNNYKQIYEECRNNYLINCKWLNELRITSIHKHPIEYIKSVLIEFYEPSGASITLKKEYNLLNNKKLDEILNDLSKEFEKRMPEIFLSTRFYIYDCDERKNLIEEIYNGIVSMNLFLEDFMKKCKCDKEDSYKISQTKIDNKIHNLLLKINILRDVNAFDYLYITSKNQFLKAEVSYLGLQGMGTVIRFDEKSIFKLFPSVNNIFDAFAYMHLCIADDQLFPTFLIIYNDGKSIIKSFQSTIKTTTYRIINEIATEVLSGLIRQVIFMTIYTIIPYNSDVLLKSSIERKEVIDYIDALTFMSCNCDLDTIESFIDDYQHIGLEERIKCFNANKSAEIKLGVLNFMPILTAFKSNKK